MGNKKKKTNIFKTSKNPKCVESSSTKLDLMLPLPQSSALLPQLSPPSPPHTMVDITEMASITAITDISVDMDPTMVDMDMETDGDMETSGTDMDIEDSG